MVKIEKVLKLHGLKVNFSLNKITLEHFQAWESKSPTLVEKWTSPPFNWFKINFDTAIHDSYLLRRRYVMILMDKSSI